MTTVRAVTTALLGLLFSNVSAGEESSSTYLYWGDTHVHSSFSGDAYALGNTTVDPDTAYRYARGLPVIHPYNRVRVQIPRPLDFMVVADHAEYMGVIQLIRDNDPLIQAFSYGRELQQQWQGGEQKKVYYQLGKTVNDNTPVRELITPEIISPVWNSIVDAAERNYQPGVFTTLIGWEWTSLPDGANLHRVVFIREGAETARQFLPYSALQSDKPESLWDYFERTAKATGASFLAIPHNSNISNGLMFSRLDSEGEPLSPDYAKRRARWEPITEVSQVKGDSETHPLLSPEDEFADFETFDHVMKFDSKVTGEASTADYARSALRVGLELQDSIGVNPFQFGMIGSTDTHTGLSTVDEPSFWGKFGIDSIPENKDMELTPGATGKDMAAQGLAAVWAISNTREAIFDAFQRREVYATTGPRIQLRFFAGWDFESSDVEAGDMAAIGYRKGVPMGGELSQAPTQKSPTLMIFAHKDPVGANLDRLQVIKGWVDAQHRSHEKVFNVAASGDRVISQNRVTPVGNTVDVKTAGYSNTIGAEQLVVVWRDPEFDPSLDAFYYVRVLEIPTPRHTLFDALARSETDTSPEQSFLQERAYSSPVWYQANPK
jgi:hypothetical protein